MKNIVFDLGGVLLNFSPEYIVSLFCEREEDKRLLLSAIFEDEWDRYDAGLISHEEKKARAIKQLPPALHESAEDIMEKWVFHLTEINGMRELLLDLKREGYSLFLLSNAPSYFSENSGFYSIMRCFDGRIFSGDIKTAKPGAEIFECAVKRFQIKPEESLFVDDRADNVATAKSLGFDGYVFDKDDFALAKYIRNN